MIRDRYKPSNESRKKKEEDNVAKSYLMSHEGEMNLKGFYKN